MTQFLQSYLIGISLAAIPGAVFMELTRRTLSLGVKHSAYFLAGQFSGNFTRLLLIYFGLSYLFDFKSSKTIFSIVSAAILLKFGISTLLKPIGESPSNTDRKSSYLAGLTLATIDPIVIAFWISFSGTYLVSIPNNFLVVLNCLCISLGFLSYYLLSAIVIHNTGKKIPKKYLVMVSRTFGIVLIGYGLRFVYSIF
jgi:threonine/homoserine/homoserine lactone efflux protein